MARVQEFYKGRRKRRNLAIVPFIVLLLLVSLVLVLFYGMQKYAVITKDGAEDILLHLPELTDDERQILLEGCLMNFYAANSKKETK